MDYWFRTDPKTNDVGPDVARFLSYVSWDFRLMKEIDLIVPYIDSMEPLKTSKREADPKAMEFYNAVIEEGRKRYWTCTEFTSFRFARLNCFKNMAVGKVNMSYDLFVKFAKTAFEMFGDKIHYWTTFNEPVIPEAGYLYAFHYPNLKGKERSRSRFIICNLYAKVIQLYC